MDLDWLNTIDSLNFLSIFDVAVDIERELNISPSEIVIPLWQPIIKFPQLFPGDSIGMRDRYCEGRYKAINFLKQQGVIKRVEIHQPGHRWETRIGIRIDNSEFRVVMERLRQEYKRRHGSADTITASP